MIGLDTNVLIRFLTQDDPIQSPKAKHIVASLTKESPGYVSLVTMAEIVWVLRRAYRLSDRGISQAVESILRADVFSVQQEQAVFRATVALKEARGAFADALIGELALGAGCSHTLTFDRDAARLPGFKLA